MRSTRAATALLRSARASCASPEAPGLFAPGRTIWTVHREMALLLGAGRALLLQLAHPLVAAGVAEHSGFAGDPWGRLYRTLDPMCTVVFGAAHAAAAARERLRAAHGRVRGVLREPAGGFPAGTPYDAADPALRLWVHATLVDTTLFVYRRFVAPLSPAAEARYYADSRELARVLDVPDGITPPTLAEFRGYVAGMLAGEALAVGATARTQARLIFRPPAAPTLRAIGPLAEFLTVGLLPPRVRDLYGYPWSPARERALEALGRVVRRVRPILPDGLRLVPHARAAEQRLRGGSHG